MKKCAIYCRVSTADQRMESQLYDLRELAAQRGIEVVAEYQDCGISGSKARRPGLDALMADARRKKFSVVLVAAFDRVARSVRHFLQVIDELESLGVVFISRREQVDTSGMMGRLFLTARGRTTQKSRAVIRCAARGRWFPPRASSGIRETAFFRPSRKRKSCENTRAARFFHSRGVPAPNSFRKTRLKLNAPTWISCRFKMFSCPRRWQSRIPPVS